MTQTDHAHHFILGMPYKGYTTGVCKLPGCGAAATWFDAIDWAVNPWSDRRTAGVHIANAKRSRKRNPRTQPPQTSCGKCGRSDFASLIGLASHEARWCKGVAA